MHRIAPLAALTLLAACTQSPSGDDGGARDGAADGAWACARDVECGDGLFCDGVERCLPGDPSADVHGCAPAAATPPVCPADEACDEVNDRGTTCTPASRDMDGDGHRSIACGGDDCDDTDSNRYPGNVERCDTLGHDEDCDPTTYGHSDHDHDGHDDAICCNGTVCGDDCDDTDASVHPGATEVCNGYDDNCNGMVDEGVLVSFFVDGDDDSWGGAAAGTGCTVLSGYATRGGDCDDANPAVHPTATETCNGVDDDCNALIDDGTEAACAAVLGGHGPATCARTPTGAVCRPAGCDMGRADCDGVASNGCESDVCFSNLECNHCGGHCICDGGGCVGASPSLGFLGTVSDVGGAVVAGATVRPLFGCQSESATTDASGQFDLVMHVTASQYYRVDATGYRPHVCGAFTLIPSSTIDTWLADPDAPADDPNTGIVVLELATDFGFVPWTIDAPGGAPQAVVGTDVLAPGASGSPTTRVVFFGVAPGPLTVAPVVPIGCSVSCPPVSTWVLPGGVSRVVTAPCPMVCA